MADAETLVDLLRVQTELQPQHLTYTFLDDGQGAEEHTNAQVDQAARGVAAMLQGAGYAPGHRVLLVFAPGLDYIKAFFGCLYAGLIAVPAYPPDPTRLARTLPRLSAMARDADVCAVLTSSAILNLAEALKTMAPALGALPWFATDELQPDFAEMWSEPRIEPDSIAFLQYTSGSTGTPKGTLLSHANLLHNLGLLRRAFRQDVEPGTQVLWLPPYHDWGLIGGILAPLHVAGRTVLMSPISFLRRPASWLEAVSKYRATISGGPNFAYDLCVRKTTPEQRAELDLSSWTSAMIAAEPIRCETMDRFAEAFSCAGFSRDRFFPMYGLAESTLIVTGADAETPPAELRACVGALEQGRVEEASAESPDGKRLAASGSVLEGSLIIVEPEQRVALGPDRIGEVWVSSSSVASGYWQQDEATAEVFAATVANTGAGPFLRTGDLGFVRDGQLYITGRLKDLIIIRGRNLYPQDLERTAEESHPALRAGCCAALGVDIDGCEQLVIVQEADPKRIDAPDTVKKSIREAVTLAHDVLVHDIVLVAPRSLPKTSSGKIRRRPCAADYLAGKLEELADTPQGKTGP